MVTVHDSRRNGWSERTSIDAEEEPEAVASSAGLRVLLICDDASDASTFSRALRALNIESVWAGGGAKGWLTARSSRFHLIVVDQQMTDVSGLDVLRKLRADDDTLQCLLMTSHPTSAIATAAQSAGAIGLVGKSLRAADVISVVNTLRMRETSARVTNGQDVAVTPIEPRADMLAGSRAVLDTPRSIAERWASLVLRTIDAEADPKTVTSWAQAVGMSRTMLCECCRLVRVAPHDARDFTRLVRAICHSGDAWQPETVLDLADMRTLKRLLARGGFIERVNHTPPLWQYLLRQRWIPADNAGLIALQRFLYGSNTPASRSTARACGAHGTDASP